MKLLFCSPCPLDRRLGAAQTLMDLAEEMTALGWQCDLVDPPRLGADKATYPTRLHDYLSEHAPAYDVVDFDYKRLAFDREVWVPQTLFVARCQLLIHHHLSIIPPPVPTLRSRFREVLRGPRDRREMQARVRQATTTLQAADLVVVLNDRDREELERYGVAATKICVVPNGMTDARRQAFQAVPVEPPPEPVVGFIGMFGPRKGGADFPDLVARVSAAVPEARFRLLGTRGRFRSEKDVLALFPKAVRPCIDVIPTFAPERLPDLLKPCAVGVFPSYLEGFGLGVLEMLAAAVPVVAYDAPGPSTILPAEYLVPPGDTAAMSRTVIRLLQDRGALLAARRWARQRARQFTWQQAARRLSETYDAALARKRAGVSLGIE